MPDAETDNFWTKYNNLCLKSKICPLRCVIKHLEGSELCCPVEAIRSEHWPLVLEALKNDNSLTKVQFESNLSISSQKEPVTRKKKKITKHYPLPYGCSAKNISQICKCLFHLARSSATLTVLKLENITLTKENAMELSLGLKFSKVTHFSLAGSLLKDNSIQIICQNLASAPIEWLDISSCDLNLEGLRYVCHLIELHRRKREVDLYPQTLRYQMPVLDQMPGLSRVSMNNSYIGDIGVKLIMDSLKDDLWMKVLDLQRCYIGNGGAKLILDTLKLNARLQIIDLRQNDIDESNIEKISWQLSLNNAGKELKYELGPLWEPRKCIRRFPRRKASLKTKVLKSTPPKHKNKSTPSVEKEIPFCNQMFKFNVVNVEEVASQTMNPELDSEEEEELISAKRELLIVKKTLVNEIKLRECLMHLLKKYKMENSLLRKEIEKLAMLDDHILIDQDTFLEVKNTFEKFKRFLDVMKEYGLFECTAMLGINENTDIVLKPMIVNATKKCMQLIENEPSVISESESVDSILSNEAKVQSSIPTKQMSCCKCRLPDCKSVKGKNGISSKLPCNKEMLQENNPTKNSTSIEKALVQRIYKEVRENYSNSSHSNHKVCSVNPAARRPEIPVRKKPRIIPKTSAVKNISKTQSPNKLKNLKGCKEVLNTVVKEGRSVEVIQNRSILTYSESSASAVTTITKKTVSSQTPSSPTIGSSSRKSFQEETEKSKSSTKITCSPSLAHKTLVRQESSTTISDQSNADKLSFSSKSKLKKASKKGKSHNSDSPSSESITPHISRNNSISSENEVPSDLVRNEMSVITNSKTLTNKMHSFLTNNKSFKSVEPEVFRKKDDASVKGFSDNDGSKNTLISSSNGRSDTSRSYLESVSDASTDKDVKSLAESEVYSSVTSEKNSKAAPNKKPAQVVKTSDASVANSNSSNSKSTKKKVQKKTSSPVHQANKNQKNSGSGSSVPSLSDITTVSSHSLNTDSVMGQLSES